MSRSLSFVEERLSLNDECYSSGLSSSWDHWELNDI